MKSEDTTFTEDPARAEQLNNALDDLRAGRSPEYFSADPEFQAALRLHISSSPASAEMDDAYEEHLQKRLLGQFAAEETPRAARWWVPRLLPVIGVALVLVIAVNVNTGDDDQRNQVATTTEDTNTQAPTNTAGNETIQGLQPDAGNTNEETVSGNTNTDDDSTTTTGEANNQNTNTAENENSSSLEAGIANADLSTNDITAAGATLTTTLTSAETDVDDSVAYSDISNTSNADIDLMITSLSSL